MNSKILVALFLFVSMACSKEDTDSTPPVIEIISPTDGQSLALGTTFIFKANFTDQSELRSFKIDIHSAEGHQHKRSAVIGQAWPFIHEGTFQNGVQSSTQELNILVPAETVLGEYHLVVYCTDIHGNEAMKYIELDITE